MNSSCVDPEVRPLRAIKTGNDLIFYFLLKLGGMGHMTVNYTSTQKVYGLKTWGPLEFLRKIHF